jgi:ribosomal protein L12E/L44/L45/RPP1/RPP2
MTDIAPETSDVSLDRVVAAVETVSIDAEDRENLHSVEDETAAVAAAAAAAAAAVEQNTPDSENEDSNTPEAEEKQGSSFVGFLYSYRGRDLIGNYVTDPVSCPEVSYSINF